MERRAFVGSSVAALGTPMSLSAGAAEEPRELYELRTYTLKPAKRPLLDEYLAKAFIPGARRAGLGPVGVFSETDDQGVLRVVVLLVHPSADSIVALRQRLVADEEFLAAAEGYLGARAADPVYDRIEGSLLRPIAGMPKLERPDASKPRLFNLRIYESHNERAAATKVEMFEKGELDLFRKVGLTPVFFASSLVGTALPNLAYLLVFPDEAGRKAAWDRFRVHPEWLRMKAIPEYADKEIVSRITNRLLAPAAYSEL
jgi:hypothetical protein